MEIVSIREARSRLSKLVDRALAGEEIFIARAGTPMVHLVPLRQDDSSRQGGQWRGKVRIAANFDDLPDDIARAFCMKDE